MSITVLWNARGFTEAFTVQSVNLLTTKRV